MASTGNVAAHAGQLIDWAQARVAEIDWSRWLPALK